MLNQVILNTGFIAAFSEEQEQFKIKTLTSKRSGFKFHSYAWK